MLLLGKFSVLRLADQGNRLLALVDGRAGSLNDLYALWGSGESSSWTVSQPLALGPGSEIASSGFGPGGALVVETRSAAGALQATTTGEDGDRSWEVLPRLPADTESVSIGSGGNIGRAQCELVSAHGLALGRGRVDEDPGARRPDRVRVVELRLSLGGAQPGGGSAGGATGLDGTVPRR